MIRSVDEGQWTGVRDRGFECERIRLHFNSKFGIKLRNAEDGGEPSVLIYQTDPCGVRCWTSWTDGKLVA